MKELGCVYTLHSLVFKITEFSFVSVRMNSKNIEKSKIRYVKANTTGSYMRRENIVPRGWSRGRGSF